MFASGFLGKIGEGAAFERGSEGWQYAGDAELVLDASTGCRLYTWDGLALLLRGYARPAVFADPLDLERIAEEIRCHYVEHGSLAVEGLEGSFTLALLDGPGRRALLYRNLAGGGFTYYHAGPDHLLFGSSLVELVDAAGVAPRPELRALPALFLGRGSTGPETLFEGFLRLLPGEQVTWDRGRLTRSQHHTFADLGRAEFVEDPRDRLDRTLSAVLADCASLRPGAVNLLSGGIGSSYLQALWNRQVARTEPLPPSFSVCLDHPEAWEDADQAVTASQALGTRHTLVPADDSYAGYLLDALAGTGEPSDQSCTTYLGHLARALAEEGVTAALCGVGGDALFGTQPDTSPWGRGSLLARLRRGGAALAGSIGQALRRAAGQRFGSASDWQMVRTCFGESSLARIAAEQRALLEGHGVSSPPSLRRHARGVLDALLGRSGLVTALFDQAGAELFCPFLDSRMVRLSLELAARPDRSRRGLLRDALSRHALPELARRPGAGLESPLLDWLAPGDRLSPLVERIGMYDFLEGQTMQKVRARPSAFLYRLLCYDLWHKLFVERSLPRSQPLTLAWRQQVVALAAG